ncbi:DUF1801 domain-containing protein [Methylophaga nitratireducenticrescens]|nr:DUF1801 domain-containing protein [Methylophaga nitratireducenticrescens]ASF49047.1 hypothetical protein Q7A_03125 [Methylophaga nitratireducenticrescens]AUZ83138.1 hypothetical protein CDW43_00440 [Methylophaga nitratireducenticrescens]
MGFDKRKYAYRGDWGYSQNFPELESKLAWNVPQICRGSDYVFGVSALKNHLALAPWSTEVMETFKARLETDGYVVKKNLFQVPSDWTIDKTLLIDLIKARLAELDLKPAKIKGAANLIKRGSVKIHYQLKNE